MELTTAKQAEVLTEALPYIQNYNGKLIIVSLAGRVLTDDTLKKALISDVVLLNQIGIKMLLVHSGSDSEGETLATNKELVSLVGQCKGRSLGLSGADGQAISANAKGEIAINPATINEILDLKYIPIIAPLAFDENGNAVNISSNIIASRLASELHATSLINLTDAKGILAKKDDDTSLYGTLCVSDTPLLIKEGIICGETVALATCCVEAIRRGVARVFMIDGTVPHSILIEVLSDKGIGTMFYA